MSKRKKDHWDDLPESFEDEIPADIFDEDYPEEAVPAALSDTDTFQIDERYFSSDADDFGATNVLPDGL